MKERLPSYFRKIFEYIGNNLFCVLTIGIVIGCWVINFSDIMSKLELLSNEGAIIYKVFYILASVAFVVIIALLLKKVKPRNNNYQKLFVILATVLGVIYLCLSPLFTGSDERSHYYRIFEITNGVMRTPIVDGVSGGELPKSIVEAFSIGGANEKNVKYRDSLKMMSVPLNEEDVLVYGSDEYATYYAASSLYSPISYIPQTVGFFVGRILNGGPYLIGMLGRLFNLVFYILIGYFAIKIVPVGKLFYLLVLISPNMLQCATVLSIDAFMNVVFLLFIAIIMKIRFNNEKMTLGRELILTGLGVIVALCKICYAPFVALIFLIKKEQYKKRAVEKYIFVMTVLFVSIVCSLIWLKGISALMNIEYPQSILQREFILSQPLEFLLILFRTFITTFVSSVECLFVGTRMYQTQLAIPALISLFYVGIVIKSLFMKDKKTVGNLLKNERCAIVGACILVAILIATALYLQYTAQFYAVANPVVVGLQGRYFIPIVLCLPFILRIKKAKYFDEKKLLICSLTISLIVWFYMMSRFI